MPERKEGRGSKNGNGKPGARVFALQYEEALTIDTFVDVFSITSHFAYALVYIGATHNCMS